MERRRATTIFAAAAECLGSHDDLPVMPAGTDPMTCVSRNRVPQPFHLVSEHDQVLLLFAGLTRVELHGAETDHAQLKPGESLYIPAGQPSRIVPLSESIQLKWRAEPGGWEAAVWYCPRCDREVFVREFNTGEQLQQECYWQACQEFNADPALRTCGGCGAVLDPADLSDIRWPDVAREIRRAGASGE
jgi:3-hydroxyanthranilate 3,4-dioxygenase